jgi:hypothetical protein
LKKEIRMFIELIEKYNSSVEETIPDDETIFEISRFPHFEKVASNVLAFFLQNSASHQLGSLFFRSLLELINEASLNETEYYVDCEVKTDQNNFIDICIYNSEFCIAIENKIFADLYNDLEDYYTYAFKKSNQNKALVIVLSLREIAEKNPRFRYITYEKYFNKIKEKYKDYIHNRKLNYLSLMFDFIKNIEKLKENTMLNQTFVKFLKNNHDDVLRLNTEIKQYNDSLRKTVKDVQSFLPNFIDKIEITNWPWRELPSFEDRSVSDFILDNDNKIALEAVIDYNCWRFQFLVRKANETFNIEDRCREKNILGKLIGSSFRVENTLNLDTPKETVAREIKLLLEKIIL